MRRNLRWRRLLNICEHVSWTFICRVNVRWCSPPTSRYWCEFNCWIVGVYSPQTDRLYNISLESVSVCLDAGQPLTQLSTDQWSWFFVTLRSLRKVRFSSSQPRVNYPIKEITDVAAVGSINWSEDKSPNFKGSLWVLLPSVGGSGSEQNPVRLWVFTLLWILTQLSQSAPWNLYFSWIITTSVSTLTSCQHHGNKLSCFIFCQWVC